MPGHKRRVVPAPGLPAGWDMTEVPGVDDLHDADGILADAMTRTAALWGARHEAECNSQKTRDTVSVSLIF